MSNPYFTKSGYPSSNARAVSATLRAEIAAIEAGFDLLPTLSGNGGEIIAVNSGATALEAITTTGTGSGVRATSPTIVTPTFTGRGDTFTPTHTDVSGTSAATPRAAYWARTNANVLASGIVTLTGDAGQDEWYLSLPVNSTFVSGYELVGFCWNMTTGQGGYCIGVPAAPNKVLMHCYVNAIPSDILYLYQYPVL